MCSEIDNVKMSLEKIESIYSAKNNPAIKSLFSILNTFPVIGELIDTSTEYILLDFQKKKQEKLLEVITLNNNFITTENVNNIEFIMSFIKIMEAVNKLTSNDKIKFYGNLLKNSFLCEYKIDDNSFEDNLQALNSLTYNDIIVLESLNSNYVEIPQDIGNQPEEFKNSINTTLNKISLQIKKPTDWIIAILDKLCGTGMCTRTIYQSFTFGLSETDTHYQISPLYSNLRKFILDAN
ncbi:hypothetical protein RBG61_11760 [Paludicola sp. MB14-C6]|uniref:hypothetical protein n=1 Tax=Paludihabitans sp. MB14-C6 TaxID=3070656 RepID=UPI0027DE66E0|nr:hypothetical protein [Paludicola sp. MB14-C6]WMJ22658.1 hypothetical protein RBG61_11760 [Paludicola sp. MB14-C6]